jgi:hypothetical protein
MLRLKLMLLSAIPLLAVQPLMASTFVVGSCKAKVASFATISAAVSTVPAGSTVLVCPGTYPEQVTITQSMTLVGIADSNQDIAMITVPSTGLITNSSSLFGESIAAQVLVQGGPVTLNNIAVDGTGSDLQCAGGTWVSGIFFAPGSSGQVNHGKVSGQVNGGCGVGIWAENTDGPDKFVTVQNSSVHDVDGFGIFVASNAASPNLFASIKGNVVSVGGTGLIGIGLTNVTGSVTGNDVSNAMFDMVSAGADVSIAFNTASLATAGIAMEGGGSVTNNRISGANTGLFLFSDGGVVHLNRISAISGPAIEFNCNSAIVSGNTINDAAIGVDNAPPGFTGVNSFDNTVTVKGGSCGVIAATAQKAALTAAPSTADAVSGTSIWQWRTPASPYASLK